MSGKKNILIITDVFSMMSGSERNITYLLKDTDHDRFKIFLACFISGELAKSMMGQGFSIYELDKKSIYSINGIKNLAFLRKVVRENNISLIVTYHESSDFYGLVLSKICHIPVITNRRDMGYKTRYHHKLSYRLFGNFFDAVVTVSQAVKTEAVKKQWFNEDKISFIYNGVNLAKYGKAFDTGSLRNELGIKAGRKVVGLVAGLRRIKGIHHFLEAAAMILKDRRDVEFLITGNDISEQGFTKEDCIRLARELDILEHIHFTGERADVPAIISMLDVGVIASLSEGFSNVILEYMASSKPVVATDVGGNREALVPGKTGFLVPPGDSEALARAITDILQDGELAKSFGEAGRKRAEELFSTETMIKKYEALFERMTSTQE